MMGGEYDGRTACPTRIGKLARSSDKTISWQVHRRVFPYNQVMETKHVSQQYPT